MRKINLVLFLVLSVIFVAAGCDDNGNSGGNGSGNGGTTESSLCDSIGDSQDSDFIDCNVTVAALNSMEPGAVQQRGIVPTPGTGKINIPFLEDRDNRNFINVGIDFNGDGVIAPYDSGNGIQEEWAVLNHPAIISPLDLNFYFDIIDGAIDTEIPYNVTIILSDDPITTADTFTGDKPDNVSFIEGTIELSIFNFENFVDPDPDTIGSGAQSLNAALGSSGVTSRDTEIMIVNGVDIVTLSGVPDLPQSINTCVPNSIANSLAWLADTFNFDLMIDEGDGNMLPVDLSDIESIGNNLLNPLLNFFGDEGGLLTRNGMVVGVLPQNIVPIKNKFVEMNNIPVKTTEVNIDPMNPGALVEELKDRLEEGCIAELKLDLFNAQGQKIGGHMVNLSGYSLGAEFKTDDFGDPIPGTAGTKKLVFIDANHTVTDRDTGMIVPQNDVYDYNISGEDILIQNYMYGPNGTATVKLVGAIIQCVDLDSDETDFSMMVTSDELSIIHVVFDSPCPDKIGSITITNDGSVAFDWFRLGQTGTRTTPSAGRLEPGESVMLMVEFTCQVETDINGNITIKAVVGDSEMEVSIPVSVDVRR